MFHLKIKKINHKYFLQFINMASSIAGNENNMLTSTVDSVNKCLFCGIIKENDSNKIVFQDEDVVAFADIKPASKYHYLIVTKKHIKDAKHLISEDKPLVEKMVATAKNVLEQHETDLNDVRFGFHWPPFHTISHLHLHAISPTREMGFIGRLIFRPDSYWFVSPDYVLSRL